MTELIGTSLFLDSNLQEYWTLEDANADKNSNNLTNNGSVTFSTARYTNGANFGSSNSSKYLSLASKLNYLGGAYSIVLWYKQSSEITSGTYTLFGIDDDTSKTGLDIRYEYNSGTPRLGFYRDSHGVLAQGFYSTQSLGTTWHQIALTYDASTIKGYLDGALLNSTSASGDGINTTTAGINIGRSIRLTSNYTSGMVDDVAVFNDELTLAEVNLLAKDNYAGFLLNFI